MIGILFAIDFLSDEPVGVHESQALPLAHIKTLAANSMEMKGRRSLISLQSVELHIWLLTSLLYGKLEAVGTRVLPPGKGSLYNRLFLMGTEVVLGLAPAPEYTFLAYLCFSCWKLLQGCSSLTSGYLVIVDMTLDLVTGNHYGLHDCTCVTKNTYSAVAIFRDCTSVIN
ncbi:hypothetical protein Bca52824_054288 [Brassica carinata]|uniref:Uncharacterized protein n=2 Tax=Brassica TaxID=3705 RepID=A0A8X7RAF3_BRACI|nr:hypothetical protein Bca52824_054288 [Brassica carinata]